MESWQKNVINKNRPELIQQIEYNVLLVNHLLSESTLANIDRDEIEARGNTQGNLAKVDLLLDKLETRVRGYENLVKALYHGKQTGALFILLQGAEEHQPDSSSNPFQTYGIEIDCETILSKDVIFEGRKVQLEIFRDCVGETKFKSIVRNDMDVSSYKKLVLDARSDLSLAISTIPDPISYYIQRSICQRNKLSPDIFTKRNDDVFLIEGIARYQLTKLAKQSPKKNPSETKPTDQQRIELHDSKRHINRQNRQNVQQCNSSRSTIMAGLTDVSGNQLNGITVKFILLEEHDHFWELAKASAHILHWIKYENGSFYYVKSSKSGGIRKIGKFLDEKEMSMTQNQFLEQCLLGPKNQPILIYDTPGMGKTTLLIELARKAKMLAPAKNVIFMPVSELVGIFGQTVLLNEETFKDKLVKKLSTSKLAQSLQRELFQSPNHSIELFLDSFDELNKKETQFAMKTLVFILQNIKNVRLIMTTRPQYSSNLEDIFGVLGYSILPFQQEHQIAFISKFWNTKFNIPDTNDTRNFAQYCLRKFALNVSSRDRHLAGIPMQCTMLAEIFSKYAQKKNPKLESSRHAIHSMYNMYKDYVEEKFDKLSECSNDNMLALLEFHTVSAMHLLFSEKLHLNIPKVCLEQVYKIRIMEYNPSNPSKPKFVHRSFAEYLAGECLVEWLQSGFPEKNIYGKPFTSFLINDVFARKSTFKFGDIRGQQFCNSNIIGFFGRSMTENSNAIPITVLADLVRDNNFKYQTFIDLLKAALAQNSTFLFEFILDIFLQIDQPIHCSWRNENLFEVSALPNEKKFNLVLDLLEPKNEKQEVLCIATKLCSLELVTTACKFLFSVSAKRFYEFDYMFKTSPLHNALRRGRYNIVEYLLSDCDKSYFIRNLPLICCLEQSYYAKDISVIKEKVDIINLILGEFPQLLHEQNLVGYPPILTFEAHPQLIKCLIEAGADIFAVKANDQNIAHLTAEYYNADQYDELLTLLISMETLKGVQIVYKLFNAYDSVEMCTPIYYAALNIELQTCTIEKLKLCSVKFDQIDKKDSSILHVAVKGKRSVELIKFFIKNKICNLAAKDKSGNTFLHYLPQTFDDCEYYEIVSLLCSQGHATILFVRNDDSYQPLQSAVAHMDISEMTLDLFQLNGADFQAVDNRGMTLLMIAVENKRSLNTLKALVKRGVYVMRENDHDGDTLAHIIADTYSPEEFHEMVEFFTQAGFGQIFVKMNKYKETPLHLAIYNFEVLPQTLDLLTVTVRESERKSHNILQEKILYDISIDAENEVVTSVKAAALAKDVSQLKVCFLLKQILRTSMKSRKQQPLKSRRNRSRSATRGRRLSRLSNINVWMGDKRHRKACSQFENIAQLRDAKEKNSVCSVKFFPQC